ATRFAHCSRLQALLVVGVTLLAIGWCLKVSVEGHTYSSPAGQGGSDLRLYRAIIERVQAGECYYDGAGSELRNHGYPTGSPFNWRPPVYAWLFGHLPSVAWGQALLVLLASATLLMAFAVLHAEGGRGQAVAGVFLLLGVFEWSIDGDA